MLEIKLQSDDVVALTAMGEALIKMANHHSDGEVPLHNITTITAEQVKESTAPASQAPEQMSEDEEQENIEAVKQAVDNQLDTDGLPWDSRIHHKDKKTNSDGTWQVRRRPTSEFTKEEWGEYVSKIKSLLKSPPSPQESNGKSLFEEQSTAGLGQGTLPGEETPPPPPLNNGGEETPPPPPLTSDSDKTPAEAFKEVMDFMKLSRAHATPNDLTKICKNHNVEKIIELQSQTTGVIEAVFVELKKFVNEKVGS